MMLCKFLPVGLMIVGLVFSVQTANAQWGYGSGCSSGARLDRRRPGGTDRRAITRGRIKLRQLRRLRQRGNRRRSTVERTAKSTPRLSRITG